MSEFITIYSTFKDNEQAHEVARALVSHQLVACVNIFPAVTSIYEWQGELQIEPEVTIFAKTKKTLFHKAKELILKMHNYENPCVVSLDISGLEQKYADWINKQTINP